MQDSDALRVRSPPQYARIGFSERTTVGGNYYGSRRFEQTLDHVASFVNLTSLDRTRHTHMNYAAYDTSLLVWIGVVLCLVQSAIFAGLNLAIFSVSRLRLEVQAATGDRDAIRVLSLRKESNFVLATVLWGNVSINVLITLLSNSVLAGVGAFVFSTFVITLLGEIIPQAYFSRNAVRMAARFTPMLKAYEVVLYPLAMPTAMILDWWLGPEGIALFRERDFRALIMKHVETGGTEMGPLEAVGALNFLDLDDIAVLEEGEPVDPRSVITLPMAKGRPVLPKKYRVVLTRRGRRALPTPGSTTATWTVPSGNEPEQDFKR